ncbi:MAG TPA: hypothetical protein VFQ39_01675, partial [Longimicrobium sp.]|nr:hypothetical protein [Longimicrobium sp.]
ARALGVPPEDVAAVGITFGEDGAYADFERASPLARSGGKLELLRGWNLPRPALMVGDGVTDLEARPAVDAFAAFMGVADRPTVAAAADRVLRGASLAPVLALAADEADAARLRASPWAEVYDRGRRALEDAK